MIAFKNKEKLEFIFLLEIQSLESLFSLVKIKSRCIHYNKSILINYWYSTRIYHLLILITIVGYYFAITLSFSFLNRYFPNKYIIYDYNARKYI